MTRIQPLFRSVAADGTACLLVIEGDQRWTIQHDGRVIASGPTEEGGILDAIARFRALQASSPRRALSAAS